MDKKEKLYKTVANSAIWNLVMGIVMLVTGINSGVLLLISRMIPECIGVWYGCSFYS